MDGAEWNLTARTKNRDRLLEGDIARGLLLAVLADPAVKPLLLNEHFSVKGLVIDACASMRSVHPKEDIVSPPGPRRNGEQDFHDQVRSNDTHALTTDPEAMLYRKPPGQPAGLCSLAHVLRENRSGLLMDAELTKAGGGPEHTAANAIIETVVPAGGVTRGANKAYDKATHVSNQRRFGVMPQVAQNTTGRRSAIDDRTTHHRGNGASQHIRKRIKRAFG